MKYHLAQLNIGKAIDAMDSDVMEEFSQGLDPVNEIAENSTGFVWRLKDETGNATELNHFDDPLLLVNMSVWQNVESLKHFMFATHHVHFLKHRKKWFEPDTEATYVLWWVKQGHIPSIDEAKSRLMMLREKGDSPDAFTFAKLFAAPNE
ncbi:DUF3291 domain-containing protein [Aliiglaciecola sp.]|nr:DUF3291 domain-containing protein [Aliiglaciecola sp.]